MTAAEFRELIAQAIDLLPDEFREALDNIEIVVEDSPRSRHLELFRERKGDWTLLGLYEGVPLNKRDHGYAAVLPDKITLFRDSIARCCRGDEAGMVREIRRTFLHEIGHYFGLSDRRLRELGC